MSNVSISWHSLIFNSLRITGPSYGGVWPCIAGFWDLQAASFEIPWFLGLLILLYVSNIPIKYFNHPIESPKVIPSTAASFGVADQGSIAEFRVASFFDGRMVGFRRFRKPIAAGCLVFLKLPSRQCRWWKKNEWGNPNLAELVSKTTRNNPKVKEKYTSTKKLWVQWFTNSKWQS